MNCFPHVPNSAQLVSRVRETAHQRKEKFQTIFFRAEVGKAFTTVLAFMAFTITVCPNICFCPAAVAGFTRVLMRHTPGTVNLPVFFTWSALRPASALRTFEHSLLFRPVCAESASAIAPLVNAFLPAAAFIAFIAARTMV